MGRIYVVEVIDWMGYRCEKAEGGIGKRGETYSITNLS